MGSLEHGTVNLTVRRIFWHVTCQNAKRHNRSLTKFLDSRTLGCTLDPDEGVGPPVTGESRDTYFSQRITSLCSEGGRAFIVDCSRHDIAGGNFAYKFRKLSVLSNLEPRIETAHSRYCA